MEDGVTAT